VTVDSIVYLVELYWPFLVGALVVGVLTGWFTYPAPGK
jgi:hypothetical protein